MSPLANSAEAPLQVWCQIAGKTAVLDRSGALYMPDDQVLIVSDMHLEKGTSWAKRGIFLPPYDTRQTLATLATVMTQYQPKILVFLGDSFHDAGGPARLDNEAQDVLLRVCTSQETFWITGNHDPEKSDLLAGNGCTELGLGAVRLVHIPSGAVGGSVGGTGEISGHLHPAASVVGRGRAVKRRCFVTDGKRMILPAFGSYTGGLNIRDAAFEGLFDRKSTIVHIIGDQQIYSLPLSMLGR